MRAVPFDKARAARLAIAALLLANVVLACGPWLVRLSESRAQVGPLGSAFWRLTIALPLLVALGRARREPVPPAWGALAGIVATGGLLFAADLGTWHMGILHTRLANATLLGNITAVLFPAYGFLVARTWPSGRQTLALLLAGGGAVLLLGRSFELSARNLAGDLLCIFAGLCYTGYLVAIDRAKGRLGPLTTLTIATATGAPLLLGFALALGEQVWPRDWLPLVLLALGSQIVGQGLILHAVRHVTPLVVGVMLLIQPIVAATIGWIVYGERLTALDGAGALAIAAAVLLARDAPPPPLQAREIDLSS